MGAKRPHARPSSIKPALPPSRLDDSLGAARLTEHHWLAREDSASPLSGAHRRSGRGAGARDTAENVWASLADWYGPFDPAARSDPTGPATGSRRVRRSGDFDFDAYYLRAGYRGVADPAFRSAGLGFRCAR